MSGKIKFGFSRKAQTSAREREDDDALHGSFLLLTPHEELKIYTEVTAIGVAENKKLLVGSKNGSLIYYDIKKQEDGSTRVDRNGTISPASFRRAIDEIFVAGKGKVFIRSDKKIFEITASAYSDSSTILVAKDVIFAHLSVGTLYIQKKDKTLQMHSTTGVLLSQEPISVPFRINSMYADDKFLVLVGENEHSIHHKGERIGGAKEGYKVPVRLFNWISKTRDEGPQLYFLVTQRNVTYKVKVNRHTNRFNLLPEYSIVWNITPVDVYASYPFVIAISADAVVEVAFFSTTKSPKQRISLDHHSSSLSTIPVAFHRGDSSPFYICTDTVLARMEFVSVLESIKKVLNSPTITTTDIENSLQLLDQAPGIRKEIKVQLTRQLREEDFVLKVTKEEFSSVEVDEIDVMRVLQLFTYFFPKFLIENKLFMNKIQLQGKGRKPHEWKNVKEAGELLLELITMRIRTKDNPDSVLTETDIQHLLAIQINTYFILGQTKMIESLDISQVSGIDEIEMLLREKKFHQKLVYLRVERKEYLAGLRELRDMGEESPEFLRSHFRHHNDVLKQVLKHFEGGIEREIMSKKAVAAYFMLLIPNYSQFQEFFKVFDFTLNDKLFILTTSKCLDPIAVCDYLQKQGKDKELLTEYLRWGKDLPPSPKTNKTIYVFKARYIDYMFEEYLKNEGNRDEIRREIRKEVATLKDVNSLTKFTLKALQGNKYPDLELEKGYLQVISGRPKEGIQTVLSYYYKLPQSSQGEGLVQIVEFMTFFNRFDEKGRRQLNEIFFMELLNPSDEFARSHSQKREDLLKTILDKNYKKLPLDKLLAILTDRSIKTQIRMDQKGIAKYMQNSLRHKYKQMRKYQLREALLESEVMNLNMELVALKTRRVTLDKRSVCQKCKEPITPTDRFSVYPDGSLYHTSCAGEHYTKLPDSNKRFRPFECTERPEEIE